MFILGMYLYWQFDLQANERKYVNCVNTILPPYLQDVWYVPLRGLFLNILLQLLVMYSM